MNSPKCQVHLSDGLWMIDPTDDLVARYVILGSCSVLPLSSCKAAIAHDVHQRVQSHFAADSAALCYFCLRKRPCHVLAA